MSKRERWLWLGAYLLVMLGVVVGMVMARRQALATMNTPQAKAEWEAWREAAKVQATEGPVQRRIPKSLEPPALVLMRDHFVILLAAALLFSSLLAVSLGWALRGAFFGRASPPQRSP